MKIFFKVLVVSVVALLSVSCNQENSEKSEGIALYTLRDAMATNPKEVLREVSELGYDYIEDAVNVLLMINPLLLHTTDPSRLPEGFNTDLLYEYIK